LPFGCRPRTEVVGFFSVAAGESSGLVAQEDGFDEVDDGCSFVVVELVEGIPVSLEPIWVARIGVHMAVSPGTAKSDSRTPVWRAPSTELDHVLRGPRSVVPFPLQGQEHVDST
jgi:hypothetical protein